MAIYSLSIKPAQRGNGQNAVAMAAYRSGSKIIDQRTNTIKDYTHKKGIIYTSIIYPENINFNREELWNMAEKAEKRKDARIAREILISLPHELSPEEQKNLAENFAKELVKEYQIAIDLSIHEPNKNGDQRNFHAHLLLTTRKITEKGLNEKSNLERENTYLKKIGKASTIEQIKNIREKWENICNLTLEKNGREEKISAKSYKKRNINRIPTIHIGKTATTLERKGIKTIKGNKNRAIKRHNQILYLREKRYKAYKEIQALNQEILTIEKEINQNIEQKEKESSISELLKNAKVKYEKELSQEKISKENNKNIRNDEGIER